VKDYGHMLRDDPAYAGKAARVASMARDPAEVLAAEAAALQDILARCGAPRSVGKIAFHAPCSLQHGQKVRGVVEGILGAAGYSLTPVADAHLCCGSAGTYSLLQPSLSLQLRANKLSALEAGRPERIVSANIGCIEHLGAGSSLPVQHWIELIDEKITKRT